MTCSSSRGTNGFARFERMSQRIDQAEAEARALAELHESGETDLEADIASREHARRVEDELATLKGRLRTSREPPD